MKAILLCAGLGERLKDVTGNQIPKCLVTVGNKPILQWQIESLFAAGVNEIIIVTGFRAEKIHEYIQGRKSILFTHNAQFATTNILSSFYLALKEHFIEEDLLIAAGDVIFEKDVLSRMLLHKNGDIVVAVDKRKIDQEAVKVTVNGEYVTMFGKDLSIKDSYGEFLGLLLIRSNALGAIKDSTHDLVVTQNNKRAYLFTMLNSMVHTYGKEISYIDIQGALWEEIDYKNDWQRADAHFRKAPDAKS